MTISSTTQKLTLNGVPLVSSVKYDHIYMGVTIQTYLTQDSVSYLDNSGMTSALRNPTWISMTSLTLEMTPAKRTKKLKMVRMEKARSQQESSFMTAMIPVRKMIMVRMPPPVMMIGTIKKSTAMISSMWIR